MTSPSREGFVSTSDLPWDIAGEGVRRKILGYDLELMLVHVQFEKGSVGYVHRHPHRQVTYIESGLFDVQLGGKKRRMGAGDCYFVPPDVDHGVVALEAGALVDVFTPAREDLLTAVR